MVLTSWRRRSRSSLQAKTTWSITTARNMTRKRMNWSKTRTGVIFAAIAAAPCGPRTRAGRTRFILLPPRSTRPCPARPRSCTSCSILRPHGLRFHGVRGTGISGVILMKALPTGTGDTACMKARSPDQGAQRRTRQRRKANPLLAMSGYALRADPTYGLAATRCACSTARYSCASASLKQQAIIRSKRSSKASIPAMAICAAGSLG